MKKIATIIAAALVGAALTAPAATAAQAAEPTMKPAGISDYSKSKRNRFWRVVRSYEPSVNYAGKKATISLGVGVCDYLRAGGDMYGLAMMVMEADAGVAEDAVIAVIGAAPVILCPDQQYKFE